MYTCAVFGDDDFSEDFRRKWKLEAALRGAIIDLTMRKVVDCFLVGEEGAFNELAIKVLDHSKCPLGYCLDILSDDEKWNALLVAEAECMLLYIAHKGSATAKIEKQAKRAKKKIFYVHI